MSISSSTGLVSGIDYASILEQLREVNEQPVVSLETEIATIESEQSALDTIQSLIETFEDNLEDLDAEMFDTKSVSSTDSSVLSAEAESTAVTGSYSIDVLQLATAHRVASIGYDSADSAVATSSGTFEFSLGEGETYSVDVDAGTTLDELADEINGLDAGVTASVINDGADSESYRLVLTSEDTGSSNEINITNDDTTLFSSSYSSVTVESDGFSASDVTVSGTYTGDGDQNVVLSIVETDNSTYATFQVSYDGGLTWEDETIDSSAGTLELADGVTVDFDVSSVSAEDTISFTTYDAEVQEAKDAIVTVDGIRVSRSSNEIDDVIEGLTFSLNDLDEDGDPVTVTVSSNTTDIASYISTLVTNYNSLVNTIDDYTEYDVDTETAAILFGDTGLNAFRQTLISTFTSSIDGLSGDYTSLSSIGITLDDEGSTVTFDEDVFEDAIEDDLDAVRALFVESSTSTNALISVDDGGDNNLVGTYSVSITTAAEQAEVSASQALTDTLASDERLIISLNNKSISVTLEAGSTIDDVVSTLNQTFADQDFAVEATEEDGVLSLMSSEYGSDYEISVFSDQGASTADQLGIGTDTISDTGVDVEGYIAGEEATGTGRYLTIDNEDSAYDGLSLQVKADAGATANVTISQGVSSSLTRTVETLLDDETGLFAAREESNDEQIDDLNEQIDTLMDRIDAEEERMSAKFVALELQLSTLNSEGDALLESLSALIS